MIKYIPGLLVVDNNGDDVNVFPAIEDMWILRFSGYADRLNSPERLNYVGTMSPVYPLMVRDCPEGIISVVNVDTQEHCRVEYHDGQNAWLITDTDTRELELEEYSNYALCMNVKPTTLEDIVTYIPKPLIEGVLYHLPNDITFEGLWLAGYQGNSMGFINLDNVNACHSIELNNAMIPFTPLMYGKDAFEFPAYCISTGLTSTVYWTGEVAVTNGNNIPEEDYANYALSGSCGLQDVKNLMLALRNTAPIPQVKPTKGLIYTRHGKMPKDPSFCWVVIGDNTFGNATDYTTRPAAPDELKPCRPLDHVSEFTEPIHFTVMHVSGNFHGVFWDGTDTYLMGEDVGVLIEEHERSEYILYTGNKINDLKDVMQTLPVHENIDIDFSAVEPIVGKAKAEDVAEDWNEPLYTGMVFSEGIDEFADDLTANDLWVWDGAATAYANLGDGEFIHDRNTVFQEVRPLILRYDDVPNVFSVIDTRSGVIGEVHCEWTNVVFHPKAKVEDHKVVVDDEEKSCYRVDEEEFQHFVLFSCSCNAILTDLIRGPEPVAKYPQDIEVIGYNQETRTLDVRIKVPAQIITFTCTIENEEDNA